MAGRLNRHTPDIFERMAQQRRDRDTNVNGADYVGIETIPINELNGRLDRVMRNEFTIARDALVNMDLDYIQQHIERELSRNFFRRIEEQRLRADEVARYASGTVTGRLSSNSPQRQEFPKIGVHMEEAAKNLSKLKEMGKTKIVRDPSFPYDFAAYLADPGEPVQVGETHTSSDDTTEFNLPWVQGPQPEKIGRDSQPVGKKRGSDAEEGKRVYAYTTNGDGQRVRQFIAQTNSPRVARYIIDACNAYAKEANAMGHNSAVIAANLRRELQEVKLANAQERVQFGRELTKHKERMNALSRDHESKIMDMRREINKANAAKQAAEQQCAEARQALADRKQKTLDEFKPTDTLAGRRIRFRKENSDESA